MKRIILSFLLVGFAGSAVLAQTFTLKSNDVGGQATQRQFANVFGCTGENISPQLSWENAPAGTKSFAITIYDKDAPTGSGFWHWLIFNIPANVKELKANAGDPSKNLAPKEAIQSITDFGTMGYGGPCPPPGPSHQYLVTVYALDKKLDLSKNTTPAIVGFTISGSTLAKASLVFYGESK